MTMHKKMRRMLQSIAWLTAVPIGVGFLIWYIRAAGADVVWSDYIRIVSEYLPDVGDITKLATPDILTRVPITYLARLINVRNFGYSVTFDRLLGIAGLGLLGVVTFIYCERYEIAAAYRVVIYVVIFSLSKWEVILNGTAWAHLVSFGLFFVSYYLAELLWRGETSAREELMALLMPILLLIVAGEYIASYAITMICASLFGLVMGGANTNKAEQRSHRLYRAVLISTLLALCAYLISRHFAVWEHAGMSDITLIELMREDPSYILRFFLKSFAGAVIGGESAAGLMGGAGLPEAVMIGIGAAVLVGYLAAAYIYIRTELYEITIFPALITLSGFINHILITVSRWRFLDTDYGLSSRYSVQFMVGIVGMLLIFSLYVRQKRALRGMAPGEKSFMRVLGICLAVLIMLGNCYTTYDEIRKARYREANYEEMAAMLLDYEDYSAEELMSALEWRKDEETLYKAIEILKDNKLNVYR